MRNILKGLALLLLGTSSAFADVISMDALSRGGAVARDRQLSEISQVLLGGRGSYFDIGTYYTPSPEQVMLKSPFGNHEGFAFKQHASFFVGTPVPEQEGKHIGFLVWFERAGWDNEDFAFVPEYGKFSLVRSVTTWGLSFADEKAKYAVAAGMQHQNVEHVGHFYKAEEDSLFGSWAYARYGKTSVQASFNGTDWSTFSLSLDLEHRSVYENAPFAHYQGLSNYLPNIRATLYNGGDDDNRLRVTWNQNLFHQLVYGEIAYDFLPDVEFHSAALKLYPDPSRLVGFEATCLRRGVRSGAADLLWGGAIDLLFLRVGYNSAYDYDNFFGAKGTFLLEIKLSLSSLEGMLFGRGAPESVEFEKTSIKDKSNGKNAPAKSLEARGIRFE